MTRPPTDQAVRDRVLRDFDTTFLLEAGAGAGAGKTTVLVSRILALVKTSRTSERDDGLVLELITEARQGWEAWRESKRRGRTFLSSPTRNLSIISATSGLEPLPGRTD